MTQGVYEPQRLQPPMLWMMDQLGITDTRTQRRVRVDRDDMQWRHKVGGSWLEGLRYYVWDSLRPPEISPQDLQEER